MSKNYYIFSCDLNHVFRAEYFSIFYSDLKYHKTVSL